VTVFGTVAANNPPDAALSFAVDKPTTGTFTPPNNMTSDVHHTTLWTSPVLASGTHTLVLTQTTAQAACVIYLDYLMYKTTSNTVGPYFVDDNNPAIKYTPAASWGTGGAEYDFLHTTHGSNAAGASFSYTFQGKGISFYGDINNGTLMSASISIDGGAAVSYVAPTQPSTVTSNNQFFKSGELSDGSHTLVVTAKNANPIWLDYILVTPGTGASAPSSSSSVKSASSSTGSGISTTLPPPSLPTTNLGGAPTSSLPDSGSSSGSAPPSAATGSASGLNAPSAFVGLATLLLLVFGRKFSLSSR